MPDLRPGAPRPADARLALARKLALPATALAATFHIARWVGWLEGDTPRSHLDVVPDSALAMLLALAAGLVLALRGMHARAKVRSVVRLLGWVVVFVLLVASSPLLMDVVAIFLAVAPGDTVAFAGRIVSVAAAALLGAAVADAGKRRAGDGVGGRVPPLNAAVAWSAAHARAVAYVVVVAALARTIAQVIADGSSGSSPLHGPQIDVATIAFVIGVLLAGTVLPLGLVQPWGRRWPRWVFPLGGRRVPRWLVAAPVGCLAGGMTLTFGTALVQFLLDPVGATASSDYPPVFWWVVLPAYFVWGLGLAVLVVAYWHNTGARPGNSNDPVDGPVTQPGAEPCQPKLGGSPPTTTR